MNPSSVAAHGGKEPPGSIVTSPSRPFLSVPVVGAASAAADAAHGEAQADDGLPPFRRLTKPEAQALIAKQKTISPWRVIAFQAMVGVVSAVLMGLLWREVAVAWSALYGAAVVVVPGLLMARGISGCTSGMNAGVSAVRFMVWEMVKVGVSVVMLIVAPKLVHDLSWPALLAGLVLCTKVYWLALLWRRR
jgi:ATP synthase protein I